MGKIALGLSAIALGVAALGAVQVKQLETKQEDQQVSASKELAELRVVLLRMEKIQSRDVHPRLYKLHQYEDACDMGLVGGKLKKESVCADLEAKITKAMAQADRTAAEAQAQDERLSGVRLEFMRLFTGPPAALLVYEMDDVITKAAGLLDAEEVVSMKTKAEWWKSGTRMTDEWHGKMWPRHSRGSTCDFKRTCESAELSAMLKRK